MIGLGSIPGGVSRSQANAVSDDGSMVVGMSLGVGNNGETAFLWDSSNGMRSLSDVLLSQGDDLSGWNQLLEAYDISGDGRTIVGYGINSSGRSEAFLARITAVPEPSSFSLLCVAGAAGLHRFRRRHAS